jgi:hypothetical protein
VVVPPLPAGFATQKQHLQDANPREDAAAFWKKN